MKQPQDLINKIKYQLHEGKHRVADWAVLRLLEYIRYLEGHKAALESRLIAEIGKKVMEDHKELFKKLAEHETKK